MLVILIMIMGISFKVEELHRHMSVNFIAPTLLTKALAKYTMKMKKRKIVLKALL